MPKKGENMCKKDIIMLLLLAMLAVLFMILCGSLGGQKIKNRLFSEKVIVQSESGSSEEVECAWYNIFCEEKK